MPNWVHNEITVMSDDLDILDRIVAAVEGPTDGDEEHVAFSFQKLVPRPDDKNDDWYNWNVANWGTKWDANHPDLHREDGLIRFTFSTAWSPPSPVITTFIGDHAKDTVVKYVWEEEQGFGMAFVFDHGNVTEKKEWDIPSTHAEIEARGGECYCQGDSEQMYPDCYFERATKEPGITPRDLEAIRPLGVDWAGTYEELLHAAKSLSK